MKKTHNFQADETAIQIQFKIQPECNMYVQYVLGAIFCLIEMWSAFTVQFAV